MKAFKSMIVDEQGDHLLYMHGLADADEELFYDVPTAIAAHDYSHEHGEWIGDDHTHDDK